MKPEFIQAALEDITAESDPTLKHLMLASLCTAVFAARGAKLAGVRCLC